MPCILVALFFQTFKHNYKFCQKILAERIRLEKQLIFSNFCDHLYRKVVHSSPLIRQFLRYFSSKSTLIIFSIISRLMHLKVFWKVLAVLRPFVMTVQLDLATQSNYFTQKMGKLFCGKR